MSRLTETQATEAALNVLDEYLDDGVEYLAVVESVDDFFADGWSTVDDNGDSVDVDVLPDADDYALIHEDVNRILRQLKDRL